MEDEPVKVGEVFKCLLAQDTRGHNTFYPFVLQNTYFKYGSKTS